MGEACLHNSTLIAATPSGIDSSPSEYQDTAWYALKVRTGGEPMTIAALTHRGFAPYCPTQKKERRYSDRVKLVDVPVFPGYVFCRFDVRQKLPIISSPGVNYIVGFANGPTPIAEEELMNVRRMLQAGASAARCLAQGQRVRVTSGPLAGVEGTLVRDSEKNRLVVSIQLLNQGASLQIDPHNVCEIEEHEVTNAYQDLGSRR